MLAKKCYATLYGASADTLENCPYGFGIVWKWSNIKENLIIVKFPMHQLYMTDENYIICLLITHKLQTVCSVH